MQAVERQLCALAAALVAAPLRAGGRAQAYDLGRAAPGSLPILPTLNGWLLGYPVAYLLSEATIGAAARHLSSTHLTLYKARGSCLPLEVRSPRSTTQKGPSVYRLSEPAKLTATLTASTTVQVRVHVYFLNTFCEVTGSSLCAGPTGMHCRCKLGQCC